MKYIISVLCIFLFTSHFVKAEELMQIDNCYPINGPANLRSEPSGKIIKSIAHGKIVRVLDIKDKKWYKIGFIEDSHNTCPSKNHKRFETGWTHKNNLSKGESFIDLIKNKKVIIANEDLNLSYIDSFYGPRGKLFKNIHTGVYDGFYHDITRIDELFITNNSIRRAYYLAKSSFKGLQHSNF